MQNLRKSAFDGIIGYEGIKRELSLLLDTLLHPEKYAHFGAKAPHTILFQGQPGVGKTLFAKSFMAASGRPSFILHKSKADGSFVDTIVSAFNEAKAKAPSILLLDDMDKYSDTEGRNDANSDEFIAIQSCLDELEEYDVIVLATINENGGLPDSLLRSGRFGKVLTLEVPRGKEAENIIAYYLSKLHHVASLDIPLIARILDGHSCASLKEIINEAGLLAAYHEKDEITMDEVIEAALKVIYGAIEDERDVAPAYRRLTAIHEAGHAIVQESLEPGSVTFVSIKKFDTDTEGLTETKMDDNYFRDITFMRNRVVMLLAGKAAVEMFANQIDVCAQNDLRRAIDIAERFVNGYASYGFSYSQTIPTAPESYATLREGRVHAELELAYLQTKTILAQHQKGLMQLVDALLEKELLFGAELDSLLSSEVKP